VTSDRCDQCQIIVTVFGMSRVLRAQVKNRAAGKLSTMNRMRAAAASSAAPAGAVGGESELTASALKVSQSVGGSVVVGRSAPLTARSLPTPTALRLSHSAMPTPPPHPASHTFSGAADEECAEHAQY
jgi:hypothetical protein